VQVKFIGATETVSGSKHLLILKSGKQILLDCGMYQGLGKLTAEFNAHLGFDPQLIDAVILSHAHIDHCGNLPFLVSQGYSKNIYCSYATADMAELLLMDSFHIYEFELNKMNTYRLHHHLETIKQLYTIDDVKKTFELFKPIDFNKEQELNDECSFILTRTGHILGSSAIHLSVKEEKRNICFTYTGDIGRYSDLLMKDPEFFPQTEYLICESTYGDKLHTNIEDAQLQLLETIRKTCIDKKGKLLIAAFSLGRTQEVLFVLNKFKNLGFISPKLKVFLDSPLSIKITNQSKKYFHEFNSAFQSILKSDVDPFAFDGLILTEKAEESKHINAIDDPCIIIAAAGMMDAGRVQHHLIHLLSNEKNTVLAVGFCAKGTVGDKLLSGEKEIHLFDTKIEVSANIEKLFSFSAHGDQQDMLQYISTQKKALKKVFLVHGEEKIKIKWQRKLVDEGFNEVIIPKKGEIFLL